MIIKMSCKHAYTYIRPLQCFDKRGLQFHHYLVIINQDSTNSKLPKSTQGCIIWHCDGMAEELHFLENPEDGN